MLPKRDTLSRSSGLGCSKRNYEFGDKVLSEKSDDNRYHK
jgi:hypothetical protein